MKFKKIIIVIILFIILIPKVNAQRGCCSHHGGVSRCGDNGRQICNDGTYSPTCRCDGGSSTSNYSQPIYRYGCTDPSASNYNSRANINDGSCKYTIYGCTNKEAINYNQNANTSDGSCQFEKQIIEKIKVKYKTKYKENTKLNYNEKKITQKGKKGLKEIVYKIILDENNQEQSKTKVEEKIIKKPIINIIERNTTKKKTILDKLFN